MKINIIRCNGRQSALNIRESFKTITMYKYNMKRKGMKIYLYLGNTFSGDERRPGLSM